MESHLPFAGLHQLLHPILDHTNALPTPQRDALYAAFGMSDLSDAPDGSRDASTPNIFLIALATLELLSSAAERAPLLVIAEDAQWLDGSTVDVLAFVARRLESDPIVLLLAIRDGGESALAATDLPQLPVERLDGAAAGALLDAQAAVLAPEVRERLLEEAAGNPLALLELPAALQAEQLGGNIPLPPWLPLTTRLERLFSGRVAQLPHATRALLLVAALDSGELAEALQAATLLEGAPKAITEEVLEPAAQASLAQLDDAQIRFRHPLVRSAICQAAGKAQLRAAHAALAIALADEPGRSVWHRSAAVMGSDEQVARELEAAATRAAHRGAPEVAVAALERAAALTRDPTARGMWLLDAVALADVQGRPELITRLLRQLETLDLRPEERTWLRWYQEVYTNEGIWSGLELVPAFIEVSQRAEHAGDLDRAIHALSIIAERCFWSNLDAATRQLLVETAERLPLSPEHPDLLYALGFIAPFERGAVVRERLPAAAATAAARGDLVALGDLGGVAGAVGDFEQASRLLATALAGLRAQGALGFAGATMCYQAWTAICLGTWPVAAASAEEAVQLTGELGLALWVGVVSLAQAAGAAVRGDSARAGALAAGVEREILALGAHPVLALVQIVRGLAALGQGRHAEAYDQLRRIFDPSELSYHPEVCFWAASDYLEAALHSEHLAETRPVVLEMERLAEATGTPLLRAQLAYARPLLADDQEAEAHYLASLAEPLAHWPFLHARLQLAYGGWLRRHRRMADARTPLRAALELFEALGATPWAERARQELRASGETSRPRTPEARDQLSPQELQIAQLAAEGLSYREIGQRLYLSHRTVGSHLYRLFPKLGITTRAELHAALAGGHPSAPSLGT
jgi:DNA-binding CsgD family transcriptional regulator